MRQVSVKVQFIPAMKTPDDPLGEKAYFTWEVVINGKRHDRVFELDGSLREMPADQFKQWTLRSLHEIEQLYSLHGAPE